ncbi:MAG: hypothetical protein HZA22_03185 [Nitrospirae bacterium]|nr:hypothetical protein [Nitrospirota bacterium]
MKRIVAALFTAAAIITASGAVQAIEPYKARTIEPYKGESAKPYTGGEVEVYKGDGIQPYTGGDIEPYTGSQADILPEDNTSIEPVQPGSVPAAPGHSGLRPLKVSGLEFSQSIRCVVLEGMQDGLTVVDVAGVFPKYAGYAVTLHLLRFDGKKVAAEVSARKVGVMSNGKLSASIPAHTLEAGSYAFTFTPAIAGYKENILAQGRFTVVREDEAASEKPAGGIDPSSVVGTWYGTASTVGTIEMKADGTYNYGGQPGGKYKVAGDGIVFTGSLAAWNNGHATLKDGNLEFYWTNEQGWKQWFSFAKGR